MFEFYPEKADTLQIAFRFLMCVSDCVHSATAQSPVLDPLQQAYTGMQHYTGEPAAHLNMSVQLLLFISLTHFNLHLLFQVSFMRKKKL